MRFYFGIIFGFLLGLTIENSFGAEHIMVDQLVPVVTNTKSLAKEVKPQEKEDEFDVGPTGEEAIEALNLSREKEQEKNEEKVSVIKDSELRKVLEARYKKHQAYLSINRYERVGKVSSNKKQGYLKIELSPDVRSTTHITDKPSVLGGDGFGIAELESGDYKLHFTFNSHIQVPAIYKVEKQNLGVLDVGFEKIRSKKPLIFHHSALSFGRQIQSLDEFQLREPLAQKEAYTKVNTDLNPKTWIFFDKHKETKIRLNPAIKSLDLIYDNPAILKHDYQVLNSDGS